MAFSKDKTEGSDHSLSTSTYCKPTFTGVMLNRNSLASKYKKGLVNCLIDCLFKICSSNQQKIIEKEEIRNILIDNYPPHIIDKEFEKYIKYKLLNVDKINNPSERTFRYHTLMITRKSS